MQPNVIYNILSWLPVSFQALHFLDISIFILFQIHSHNCIVPVSDYLNEALDYSFSDNGLNVEILILLKVSHMYSLTQSKLDMYQDLLILQEVLEASESLITGNCVLLMLTRLIDLISPIYLSQVMEICKYSGILVSLPVASGNCF